MCNQDRDLGPEDYREPRLALQAEYGDQALLVNLRSRALQEVGMST